MLKHLTLVSLASALVLSVAAAGPASAHGSFGHARYFGHPGARMGGHFHARSYFGRRVVHLPGHNPHFHWWHHRHGSHGWHYGVGYYGGYPVYDGGLAVSTPAPAQACTCLTKTYLQDGTVVFADQCTKESAAAAPAGPAPRG